MNVVLLEACDPSRSDRLFVPMGLAYIAAWLEREMPGAVVSIVRTVEEAIDLEPDLVGISAVSPSYPWACEAASILRRELDVPVILGGPHLTGLPRSLPADCVAGVLGEGEESFAELVAVLAREGHLSGEHLAAVKGIVFHSEQSGGGTVITERRPLVRPLDRIPFPKRDWAELNPALQWSFSSRGCPYRCRFCSTAEFWDAYRMHSPRYVVDELNGLIRDFDLHYHTFMDDLFVLNRARLAEIVAVARDELVRPLDLTVTVRADLVEEPVVALLRELGVKYVHLGLESGSDRVLQYLKNATTTVRVNQAAIDMLYDAGIRPIGTFIIGAPGEEDADLEQTLSFIESNLQRGRLVSFSFGPLVAFPGTALWELARENAWIDEATVDWRLLDIDIRYFDPDRYIMLNPQMRRERFAEWFERFKSLWEEAVSSLVQGASAGAEDAER